jgi:single-stranded DNA-binding protein
MGDTNYIGAIVKILESPINKTLKGNISVTTFRAQLPQVRQTQIVNVVVWGNLANDVAKYYRTNDYILIEGYLSLQKIKSTKGDRKIIKRSRLTVFKAYPFLLEKNRQSSQVS